MYWLHVFQLLQTATAGIDRQDADQRETIVFHFISLSQSVKPLKSKEWESKEINPTAPCRKRTPSSIVNAVETRL
jgi:hypothetical protein